jgi:hypothetical protein
MQTYSDPIAYFFTAAWSSFIFLMVYFYVLRAALALRFINGFMDPKS